MTFYAYKNPFCIYMVMKSDCQSGYGFSLQVLSRLAPLERGLYEDYVANFWCSTSLLVKWKQFFSIPMLARLAMGMTIGASLPSMVQQILAPSAEGFLFSMLNSSFAFYLFAFQDVGQSLGGRLQNSCKAISISA
jgi:hypothetical protein